MIINASNPQLDNFVFIKAEHHCVQLVKHDGYTRIFTDGSKS